MAKKKAATPKKATVVLCPSDVEAVLFPDLPINMTTFSGMRVDFANIRADQIEANDIIVSLCRTCRFTGHLGQHYSIAQHSLNCLLVACHMSESPELQVAALLHDAHEAYMGDINRPMRTFLARHHTVDWKAVERYFNGAILAKFGLKDDLFNYPFVKKVDDAVLAMEDQALQLGYGCKLDEDFISPAERQKLKLRFDPLSYDDLHTHFTCNLRHYLGKVRSL